MENAISILEERKNIILFLTANSVSFVFCGLSVSCLSVVCQLSVSCLLVLCQLLLVTCGRRGKGNGQQQAAGGKQSAAGGWRSATRSAKRPATVDGRLAAGGKRTDILPGARTCKHADTTGGAVRTAIL